jgi:hypothetical protein
LKIPSFKDTCLKTINLRTGYTAKGPKEIPNTATKSLTEGEVAPGFQNSSSNVKQEQSTYKEQMGEHLYSMIQNFSA